MTNRERACGAAALVAVCTVIPAAAAAATAYGPLLQWRDLAAKCERPYNYTGGDRALLAVAMFDAVNAVERRFTSFGPRIDAPAGTSAEAALAQAAHDTLAVTCPAQKGATAAALAAALGAITDQAARANGVDVGRRAAAAVIGARANAGIGRSDPVPAPATAGEYVQTTEFWGTQWASARPWALERPDQFRAPPPPPLTSEEWARDLEEIRRLGGQESDARTRAQTEVGQYWGDTSVSIVLRQLVGQPGRSLVDDARFLALAEIAWFDAYVSLFEGKYHYRFWRPITAIRNADLDGNDATAPQRDWTPLRETPPHPEYPCGHCVSAAAVGAVIAAEFGERMPSIVIDRPGSTVHRFDTAQEYVDEVSISRLYAGAHPRFSVEAGKVSGTAIGEFVVERYFRPLADARP